MDSRNVPASDLVRQALADTRELVKLEVALARDEVRKNLLSVRNTAIAAGIAAICSLLAASLLLVALALAIELSAIPALIIGGVLLIVSIAAGIFAWSALPKKPVEETQKRIQTDVKLVKEHVTS
jgi:protein-S-isoprenylcysteine O-methyltransferase Ste14